MMSHAWRTLRTICTLLFLLLCFSRPFAIAKDFSTIELKVTDYPVVEDGAYTSMEEVSVYLQVFGRLPQNFITKRQAAALGWDSLVGNLDEVAPGYSIGGDRFGNYEGKINPMDGNRHEWQECDINYHGGHRNGQRIVFSQYGLIFYTDDHYHTFRQVCIVGGTFFGNHER